MTISVKAALLPEEDPELRRWLVASAVVAAMHAGILWWLMHKMDLNLSGAPPAAVMIELPPMDVSPPAETSPDVAEGPEMRQAEPEEVETPQVVTPQEIPPAKKPDAVLVTTPKPNPKPKKIVKEKPVVKRTHEPPRRGQPRPDGRNPRVARHPQRRAKAWSGPARPPLPGAAKFTRIYSATSPAAGRQPESSQFPSP
jgi:periplasmic protein TonB